MPWPFLKSYIIWDKSYWSCVFGDNKGTAVFIAPSCRSTFYFAKQKSYKLIPLPKGKPDNQERELMFLILVWPGSWRQETSFSFCDITASASTKMNDLSEWTHLKKIKLKLKQPMKKKCRCIGPDTGSRFYPGSPIQLRANKISPTPIFLHLLKLIGKS